MKILYITNMYPSNELPQYCIFLHQQVKLMQKNGVEITVLVPSLDKESGFSTHDGVNILTIKYKDYARSVFYPLVTNKLIKETNKYLNVKEYDLILAIHSPCNILNYARVLAKKNKKPFVVNYRGYNIFEEYEKEGKVFLSNPEKVKEKVVKDSSLSIGVSQKTVDVITERFKDAPVAVVYNGVDGKVFTDENHKKRNDKIIKILCVANLIPIKGHKYLFDAYKQIFDEHKDIKLELNIIGRGFYKDELINYVKVNEIKNVNFYEYMPNEEVAEYMKDTDIFVLPSVYESFGNVCAEAMATKKPVVIFKGQGIDEIIEDGVSGLVAERGNTKDLKNKIESLVLDESLRNKIAEQGYNVIKNYTWDKSAKNLISLFEGVIEKYGNKRNNTRI